MSITIIPTPGTIPALSAFLWEFSGVLEIKVTREKFKELLDQALGSTTGSGFNEVATTFANWMCGDAASLAYVNFRGATVRLCCDAKPAKPPDDNTWMAI